MTKKLLVLLPLLVLTPLCSCSPGAKPISPPPYPPPETNGTVMGKLMLQGRMTYEGVSVAVGELPPVTTGAGGTYVIQNVPQGQHAIRAEKAGYLGAEDSVTIVGAREIKTMPTVVLLPGDLNGDATIDLFDLVLVGSSFGAQDATSLRVDLNGDGTVNLFDLVLVGNNMYQTGPIPFTSPQASPRSLRLLMEECQAPLAAS